MTAPGGNAGGEGDLSGLEIWKIYIKLQNLIKKNFDWYIHRKLISKLKKGKLFMG